MKRRTSVTLSKDILKAIAREARKAESRSEVIERLLRECLTARALQAADAHDLAILNKHAEQLNAEVAEVIALQADL